MLDDEITEMERELGGRRACERYLCLLERAGRIVRMERGHIEKPADLMGCRFEIEQVIGDNEHEVLARTYEGPAHRGLDGAFEWAEGLRYVGALHSVKIVGATNASVLFGEPIFKYVFAEQRERDQIEQVIEVYRFDFQGAKDLIEDSLPSTGILVDTSDPWARSEIDAYARGSYVRAGNPIVYPGP